MRGPIIRGEPWEKGRLTPIEERGVLVWPSWPLTWNFPENQRVECVSCCTDRSSCIVVRLECGEVIPTLVSLELGIWRLGDDHSEGSFPLRL